MSRVKSASRPSSAELELELNRVRFANRYGVVLMSTLYSMLIVASFSILVATLWLPVLQIYGNSMSPTFSDGEIVIAVRTEDYQRGDLVAFYRDNKILVKRVIACAGEWVDMDEGGTVYVNDVPLEEIYVSDKSVGICDIDFPYQVTEGAVFVLGDHRDTSVDSRSTAVGCVSHEQMVGEIVFRIWPLDRVCKIRQGG